MKALSFQSGGNWGNPSPGKVERKGRLQDHAGPGGTQGPTVLCTPPYNTPTPLTRKANDN